MTPWQYFPTSDPAPDHVDLVQQFELKADEISSETHDLNSNAVLAALRPGLVGIGYRVESSKAAVDRINVPVFFTATVAFKSHSTRTRTTGRNELSSRSKRAGA